MAMCEKSENGIEEKSSSNLTVVSINLANMIPIAGVLVGILSTKYARDEIEVLVN